MALTSKQKESLHEHFRNRELYDPSKVAHQEVSTFLPKTMGHAKDDEDYSKAPGFDDGTGPIGGDPGIMQNLENSELGQGASALWNGIKSLGQSPVVQKIGQLTDPIGMAYNTGKSLGSPAPKPIQTESGLKDALVNTQTPPIPSTMTATPSQAEPFPSDLGPSVDAPVQPFGRHSGAAGWSNDPNAGAAGNSSGLPNDQYAQLVAALSKGPSGGQIAASGLGALADGIMQGVARAGNPGFQKGIDERAQQQKQNLIAALEQKYKGQQFGLDKARIGIDQQRANDENTRAAAALASEDARAKAERGVQLSGQKAETDRARAALGVTQGKDIAEENKNVLDQENKAGTWLGKLQGLAAPNPALVARAQGKGVSAPQVKVIGGVTYHQVGGKWYKGQ